MKNSMVATPIAIVSQVIINRYNLDDITLVHINKGSVTIMINNRIVLITKRLMNQLLHDKFIEAALVENINPNGGSLTWLAKLSIF